ncbi:SAGA-associated factor 73 [Vanrija pseudolonga]|uniref:SAGA-associated factor 73 n=1 Tax=Vanrija pseudolonga TaxID=143232 RepID=A0AAF1BM10_9TREE|nr:SAGA-associated factor 73 [Vanrija pseudolonga]
MALKLRARDDAPARPAFSFATSPPPVAQDVPGSGAAHPRPPGDFLPERDMHMYGAQPLEVAEPGRSVVRCTRCGRNVLEWAAGDHRRICSHVLDGAPLTVKKTLKADKRVRAGTDDPSGKKRRASEVSPSDSPEASPSKKKQRLLHADVREMVGSDDELDLSALKHMKKSEIKKLQKEHERLKKRAAKEKEREAIAERKRQRASNPLDYDRQCGVINDKGLPCSRSLTCKTHTVGAKRAVQGRTRPYDELFIEWQRAHNPNFKEPVPKKDKEAAKANGGGSGAGSTLGAADRKAAAAKKRRLALDGDDGLRFDEDGHREMEELIRATRICGDRVRTASYAIGSEHKTPSVGGSPPAQAATPSAKAAAPLRTAPSSTGSFSDNLFVSASPWQTTSYEQFSMGDLLTKALAARPRPSQQTGRGSISGASKPGPIVPPLVTPVAPATQGVTA